MPACSGTPLPKKLGLAPGRRVVLVGAPDGFEALLGPAGEGGPPARSLGRGPWDLALLFAPDRAALVRLLPRVQAALDPDGAVWVAWPKRASGVATDLTEDVVRAEALARGLVDVKVCAIDATWSGLRLCVPVARRPSRGGPARARRRAPKGDRGPAAR